MTACASWVTDPDQFACDASDFDTPGDSGGTSGAELLERWGLIATTILYARTGRQYPGVCTDEVWPCRPGWDGQSLAYVASGGSRPITCGCRTGAPLLNCGHNHSAVLLPHVPVRRILTVTIDGVPLANDAFRLVDRRWLVRAEGSWPACNDLGAPDDAEGTWTVAYSYGVPPPAGGAEMAGIYACELAKGFRNDEACRLPRRVTSLTREGVTMAIIDPFDFLEQGLTGLYEVDAWVSALNPQRADRAGKVINPDLIQTHRVR